MRVLFTGTGTENVMAWTAQLIHFVDFEGSLASGILEYGVVTLRGTQVLGSHTRLCRPTGRVRLADRELHGIDPDSVADCALFHDDFALFANWRATGPLAAHFANAENTLIKSVWPYPRSSPDFIRAGEMTTDWGPWLDTGRLYPQIYPGLTSSKLGDLVAAFGLQGELDALAATHCPPDRRRYHAALYDALAGALLLARLASEPSVAGQSLPWLIGMSTLDGDKRDSLWQGSLF